MTKLIMPEPALNSFVLGPLYTAEALRDVLEQAAKACEAGALGHGECAAMIRAMKEQVK